MASRLDVAGGLDVSSEPEQPAVSLDTPTSASLWAAVKVQWRASFHLLQVATQNWLEATNNTIVYLYTQWKPSDPSPHALTWLISRKRSIRKQLSGRTLEMFEVLIDERQLADEWVRRVHTLTQLASPALAFSSSSLLHARTPTTMIVEDRPVAQSPPTQTDTTPPSDRGRSTTKYTSVFRGSDTEVASPDRLRSNPPNEHVTSRGSVVTLKTRP